MKDTTKNDLDVVSVHIQKHLATSFLWYRVGNCPSKRGPSPHVKNYRFSLYMVYTDEIKDFDYTNTILSIYGKHCVYSYKISDQLRYVSDH